MSYGPFSRTVYANFPDTKNISEILRGKEVAFPYLLLPLPPPFVRVAAIFLRYLKYPAMI